MHKRWGWYQSFYFKLSDSVPHCTSLEWTSNINTVQQPADDVTALFVWLSFHFVGPGCVSTLGGREGGRESYFHLITNEIAGEISLPLSPHPPATSAGRPFDVSL